MATSTPSIEVCRPTQQVLAGLAAADGGIVGGGAVAAGDMQGLSKVLPDALEQHHKLLVEEHDVAALAAELPHPEAGRELPGGVPAEAVFTNRHKCHDLSFAAPPRGCFLFCQ